MAYTKNDISRIIDAYGSGAFQYQMRRHPEWTENYILYRDKVITNRITQRQSVNIPLMKYQIKTALKEVDDPIDMFFRNRDNDKQAEIFINEFFQMVRKDQKIDVRDIVDKKMVMQTGRATSGWNIYNGKVTFELNDSFDIFFDEYTDPTDIDGTCMYMDQRHIFKPLDSLRNDPRYDKVALDEIADFYKTALGVAKIVDNYNSLQAKNDRMQKMGYDQVNDPEVGDTYVEMRHHWVRLWDSELEEMVIYFVVSGEGRVLYFAPQEDVIGKTQDNFWRSHFIKTSWADDIELNDVYSDGLADMIRPVNKVVNAWFSQDVENRTLRNYGMNYFNSSMTDFAPQTFQPVPWGWYPIPVPKGMSIADVVQNVHIEPLSDTLPAIQWAIQIAEKAAATSSTAAGQVNEKKVTLGEVELVLQESKERLKTMSNYYLPAWQERGLKFIKLIEAAGDRIDVVKIFKKGYRGNMFSAEIDPSDWITESGYSVEVTNKTDVRNRAVQTINTLNAVKTAMPNNVPLQEIYERKLLDLIDGLTPDEIKQVTDFQKKVRENQDNAQQVTGVQPGQVTQTQPLATMGSGVGQGA